MNNQHLSTQLTTPPTYTQSNEHINTSCLQLTPEEKTIKEMTTAPGSLSHQPRPFSIRDILDLDREEKTPPTPPSLAKKRPIEEPSTAGKRPSHSTTAEPYKRHGNKFSPTQTERLEEAFTEGSHPSREHMEELGVATGLLIGQVQVWFQNRRAKERKRASAAQRLAQMQRGAVTTPPVGGVFNHGDEHFQYQTVSATPTLFVGGHPLLVTPLSLMPGAWPLAYQLNVGVGSSQKEESGESPDTHRGVESQSQWKAFKETNH